MQATHKQFIAAVEAGRGERLKDSADAELFSGLVWTGEQAVGLGLIDRLGDSDYVAREVVGVERIVDFSSKQNVVDRFANKLGTAVANQLSLNLGFGGMVLR